MNWLVSTLTSLSNVGYTGKIELNFNQGGLTGINFNQSIKPLQEVRIIPIGGEVKVSLN